MFLVGDLLELLGASALAVAGFLIAGLIAALIVVGVFLLYQAHFGAYGPVIVPRPATPRLHARRRAVKNA